MHVVKGIYRSFLSKTIRNERWSLFIIENVPPIYFQLTRLPRITTSRTINERSPSSSIDTRPVSISSPFDEQRYRPIFRVKFMQNSSPAKWAGTRLSTGAREQGASSPSNIGRILTCMSGGNLISAFWRLLRMTALRYRVVCVCMLARRFKCWLLRFPIAK